MTTAAHGNDFAFDYTRGANANTSARKGLAQGRLKTWFTNYVARREAAAMAHIAMIDPRLAQEIRAAKDHAELGDGR